MDDAFAEMMTTTVVVSTGEPTRDLYGTETWSGNGSTYRAHYTEQRTFARSGDSHVVAHEGVLYVDCTGTLSTNMRVRIGSATGPAYPIAAVHAFRDAGGALHHYRVRLGMGRG